MAEATKKDPGIDNMLTSLSRKEYGISGLCQSCQDQIFGVSDE